MSKDLFHNMHEQMVPSEKIVDELYEKIEASKSNLDTNERHTKIKLQKTWQKMVVPAACVALIALILVSTNFFNDSYGMIDTPPHSTQGNSSHDTSGMYGGDSTQRTSSTISTISTTSSTNQNTSSTSEAGYVVPHWNDMPIFRKYGEVSYNKEVFVSQNSEIVKAAVGDQLGTATAQAYDIYNNDKEYTISCTLYSLKSISVNCAIAVKFEGADEYFSYANTQYLPNTLGDLIKDVNLHENLVFNNAIGYDYWENDHYVSMQYSLPDVSVIWDLLLSDTSLKNEGDEHYTTSEMDISINVKIIGQNNLSLSVNNEGYLQTNILGSGKSFFIGKDAVQNFINYVLNHGSGTVINPNNTGTTVEAAAY